MWVTCGISMCSTELADGYDCENPGEHFVLCESLGKVRISTTVSSLGNVLTSSSKEKLPPPRKIQHIRAEEYRITPCIISLHLHIGASALRKCSENVLEQEPEKL